MRRCPNCRERNPNDAAVCRFCGQLLPGASKSVTAGPVSSPDTSRVDATSVAGPAAVASGIVTAGTVLLFIALRGFLPPEVDRLLILAVPYFLVLWGAFALLISYLRRKNRSLRSAIGSALLYLLVGALYIFNGIAENWETPSSQRAPEATARPAAVATSSVIWPLQDASAIRGSCKLLAEVTPSWAGRQHCFRGTADVRDLIRYGDTGRSQDFVIIQRPVSPGSLLYGAIRVPSAYYLDTFLPEVTARFKPQDKVCFNSGYGTVLYEWTPVEVSGRSLNARMIFIDSQIRLCPDSLQ